MGVWFRSVAEAEEGRGEGRESGCTGKKESKTGKEEKRKRERETNGSWMIDDR